MQYVGGIVVTTNNDESVSEKSEKAAQPLLQSDSEPADLSVSSPGKASTQR